LVVEPSLDPLLPLGVLFDQRATQSHLGAQIKDVIGRDPRLRQPPGQPQFAVMASVRTVDLGVLVVPASGRCLGRLGQMHHRAHRPQLLDQKRQPVLASSPTSSR
jgi:hypothetical protein